MHYIAETYLRVKFQWLFECWKTGNSKLEKQLIIINIKGIYETKLFTGSAKNLDDTRLIDKKIRTTVTILNVS